MVHAPETVEEKQLGVVGCPSYFVDGLTRIGVVSAGIGYAQEECSSYIIDQVHLLIESWVEVL